MLHTMLKVMNKKNLFAYGDHAFEMYEKAPQNITVSFPVINGVIADINHMQILLRNFINDAMNGNIRGADYYISVPVQKLPASVVIVPFRVILIRHDPQELHCLHHGRNT